MWQGADLPVDPIRGREKLEVADFWRDGRRATTPTPFLRGFLSWLILFGLYLS
jgi:hypothetical protein